MTEIATDLQGGADALDRADPLRHFRSRFLDPGPQLVAYLDGNSLGRPLADTGARLWSCRRLGHRADPQLG
jgi:kynureninase